MSDSPIISRLDKFVIALLDEAEVGCEKPAESDTNGKSEDAPGSQTATRPLADRVSVLKAATSYLSVRNRIAADEGSGGEEDEEPPEIVKFEQRIRNNRARRR